MRKRNCQQTWLNWTKEDGKKSSHRATLHIVLKYMQCPHHLKMWLAINQIFVEMDWFGKAMSCKRQSNSNSLNNISLPPPPPKKKNKNQKQKKVFLSFTVCSLMWLVKIRWKHSWKQTVGFFNAKWTRSGCNEVVSGVGVEWSFTVRSRSSPVQGRIAFKYKM